MKEIKTRKVISHTTRKPRVGEVCGRDYYFVNDEEFKKLNLLEETFYHVNGETWRYGLTVEEIKKDFVNVCVINPSGVSQILEKINRKDVIIIEITTPFENRKSRYIKRDPFNPSIETQFEARAEQDEKDFEKLKFEIDYTFENSDMKSMFHTVNGIRDVILKKEPKVICLIGKTAVGKSTVETQISNVSFLNKWHRRY